MHDFKHKLLIELEMFRYRNFGYGLKKTKKNIIKIIQSSHLRENESSIISSKKQLDKAIEVKYKIDTMSVCFYTLVAVIFFSICVCLVNSFIRWKKKRM